MSSPQVRVFASLDELSRQAAIEFCDLAKLTIDRKGTFSAALSGGSTPRRLYELLAGRELDIPWQHVQLFQVDERCVPPSHFDSNFPMIREALLSRAPIPEVNFHRIRGEHPDPGEAARAYEQELVRILQPKPGEPPALDLIFLGMGADGHTASLFPGSEVLEESAGWVRATYVQKFRMHRLTLTLPVLNAASRVIFLVSGAEKAETLREVLQGLARSIPLPAQRVGPMRDRLSWYVDEAAARLLEAL